MHYPHIRGLAAYAEGYGNGDHHLSIGPCGLGRTLRFFTVQIHRHHAVHAAHLPIIDGVLKEAESLVVLAAHLIHVSQSV